MDIVPLTPFHKEWVQHRTQHPWVEDTIGLIALRGGRPMGAFVLDSFTRQSANVHCCLDSSMVLRSDFVPACLDMAYNELNLGVLFAGIAATNIPMLRLATRLGFMPLGIMENALAPGVGRIMMERRREHGWLSYEEESDNAATST